MAIEQELTAIGLHEKESRVLCALLELGKGSVSEIAKQSGIPRTTLYPFIAKLIDHGLIAKEIIPEGGVVYSPNDPMALHRLLERDKDALRSKERKIAELIETLTPMLQGERFSIPKLQFVQGKKAVEELLYQSLPRWRASYKRMNYYRMWGYQDDSFVHEYKKWHEYAWKMRRPEEEISLFSTPQGVKQQRLDRIPRRELRLLPSGHSFPCSIWIHADHVLFAMTRAKPHYAVLLVDKVISAVLRELFEMLWALTSAQARTKGT